MIRQDPILIAAPPRSGTTVLAAVLHAHGIWVGKGRTTRYPGTNMNFASENTGIKTIFKETAKEMGYENWDAPIPNLIPGSRLKSQIEDHVEEDTPWLIKASWNLVFWQFLKKAYPKARWLFPVRDIDKIIDSMNRHPGMVKHSDAEKYAYVNALQRKRFEVITTDVKYHCFNIEKFVSKDVETIDGVFAFLGITPDWNVINNTVKCPMLKV